MVERAKAQNALDIPDDVLIALDQADRSRGFPPGTMQSLMQQEIGGQLNKFLGDPTAPHFKLNKEGKRVGPSGKISTAFGPFGILESTAADPGFGVKPLTDKSFQTQLDFAADYLAGRSKKGGLAAGLAGYGEGKKYASEVLGRINVAPDTPGITTANARLPIPRSTPNRPSDVNAIQLAQNKSVTPPQNFVPLPQRRPSDNANTQQVSSTNLGLSPVAAIPTPNLLSSLGDIGRGVAQQQVPIQQFSPVQDNRQAVLSRLNQINGTEIII